MGKDTFKETKIGKVPGDWEVKKIRDLDDPKDVVQTGPFGSILHASDYAEEGVPLLLVKNIDDGKIADADMPKVRREKANELKRFWLQEGDIVFTRVGAVGRTLFVKQDYEGWMFSGQTLRIRIKNEKVNNQFVEYFFRTPQFQNISESTALGTTRPSINTTILANTYVPIPSKVEQDKIVGVLSSIDFKIELNHQMNITLEKICQALFKHWFIDFEFPNEKGEPYKSSGGKMVDSGVGEIPEGWEVKDNISEICEKINYGYTQSASKNEVGPKFLRVMDINKSDWIEWANVPYCEIDTKDLPKYLLEKGDIVIVRMADPGKVAIFETDTQAVFASYLIRIGLKNKKYSYYLYYFMKSRYYQEYIMGAATGSVQKSLNAQGLTKGLPVIIPDEKTIDNFNKIVGSLREKLNKNVIENESLGKMRDSLLPRLMSGQIRVR